jgi:hypothetical protein
MEEPKLLVGMGDVVLKLVSVTHISEQRQQSLRFIAIRQM